MLKRPFLYVIAISLFVRLFNVPSSLNAETIYKGLSLALTVSESDINALGEIFHPSLARYQLHYGNADDADRSEYESWVDSAISYLDSLIPAFQSNGIKIVLALHTPPGGFSEYGRFPKHRLFQEEWPQESIISVWQKLAQHYNGNSTVWAYDIVNEPAAPTVASGLKDWPTLASDIIQAIRNIDTETPIIVEPRYGDAKYLGNLRGKLPSGQNLLISSHPYDPQYVTHQGVRPFKKRLKFPSDRFPKSSALKQFKKLRKFAKRNGTGIYIGEFSISCFAKTKTQINYLKTVIRYMKKIKAHWTYHAFREADVWSPEHTCRWKGRKTEEASTLPKRAQYLIKQFQQG